MQRFKEFKDLVENQTRERIRVLQSRSEGEYISKEFNEFCAQEGVKRQMTVPYTPQQNGATERKNKTIVGAARSTLHD